MANMLTDRTVPVREAPGEPRAAAAGGSQVRRPGGWLAVAGRAGVSLALVAAVIAGAMSFQRYLVATKPATPRIPTPERVRPVDTVIAKTMDAQPTLRLYGQISAGRSVDLRMLVGGEIAWVAPGLVDGGKVAKGAELVKVDAFDLDGALVKARTEVAEAEARINEIAARVALEGDARRRAMEQLAVAEREVARLTMLQERAASSVAALDASRSRLAAARLAVEVRDSQVRVLEAQSARELASLDRLRWNIAKAERDIRNATLFSPFEGIASNVAAEVGRLVNVNDRVATIVDLERFEVRYALTDAQYGRLVAGGDKLEGRKVTVIWQGGGNEIQARGTVDRLSPVVAAQTAGFEVIARLERSPATEALRPGAFVAVLVDDVPALGVVRVPQAAVHPGNRIFQIGADNRLSSIEVTIAGFDGDEMLVRGPIPEGSQIMASRLPDAGPGVLVKGR
jgi:RND family efflux transporter MFP subunit